MVQVVREDIADIIDDQNSIKNQGETEKFDLYRLIFETQGSGDLLKKVQN